uniref:Uncharacterized protein n=1 Tax=Rhizophora mucronata TaxID=61149 RepID=A0A2P2QW47_RHIMU
MFWPETINIS